ALLVCHAEAPLVSLRYSTHAVDVLSAAVLMYWTEGSTSPFFLSVLFALLCAMCYWQGRGLMWTAVAVLTVCLRFGVYAAGALHEAAFALHTFVMRGVYVVVVAMLLRSLNAYHQGLYAAIDTLRREQEALLQQGQQATAGAEYRHLARNLHDGVLQSL